jgi:hypothetical protein
MEFYPLKKIGVLPSCEIYINSGKYTFKTYKEEFSEIVRDDTARNSFVIFDDGRAIAFTL